MSHAWDDVTGNLNLLTEVREIKAVQRENDVRFAYYKCVPNCSGIFPRPGVQETNEDLADNAEDAWEEYIGTPSNGGHLVVY